MWFYLALISAVLYASLWLFARASRGIPSAFVTASIHVWAPFALFFIVREIDFPWHESWWQLYMLFTICVIPGTLWALTFASQRSEVTVINPLAALSTIATLAVSILLFEKQFELLHIAGIFVVVLGLFFLYHGAKGTWRKPWPWIVLVGVLILGVNVAIIKEVLERFPHPIAVLAFASTCSFSVNAIFATGSIRAIRLSKNRIVLLLFFLAATVAQDFATFFALSMGPAPHVVAIKRTSILFAAFMSYFLFGEKEQPLWKLMTACVIVVVGVALLNFA